MFSALKRLTGKAEGGNNVPRPSHQSMSHSLQKKFARGVQYNSKYWKWIKVTMQIYRMSLLLCLWVYDGGHGVLWQIQVFYGMKLLFLYKMGFLFQTIQNNHFFFLIIVELASFQVLLQWPQQVIHHNVWSFSLMQCHTVLSNMIVVTILSLGTSGPSTLLFIMLQQQISCCQYHRS